MNKIDKPLVCPPLTDWEAEGQAREDLEDWVPDHIRRSEGLRN